MRIIRNNDNYIMHCTSHETELYLHIIHRELIVLAKKYKHRQEYEQEKIFTDKAIAINKCIVEFSQLELIRNT